MRKRLLVAWMIAHAVVLLYGVSSHAVASSDFTVRDSIESTQLIQPSQFHSTDSFSFSPDRRYFFVVLRRGNLATGNNDYFLELFNSDSVLEFVSSADGVMQEKVIATFSTPSNRLGIEQVRWYAAGHIVLFVGRGQDGRGQAYAYDVDSGRLEQLTDQPDDLAAFDVSFSTNKLAYSARSAVDRSDRDARGFLVTTQTASVLMGLSPDLVVNHFVLDMRTRQVRAAELEPTLWIRNAAKPIVISPSGRLAVIEIPVKRYPKHWYEYEFIASAIHCQHH
jgi:WD40 repeat protein